MMNYVLQVILFQLAFLAVYDLMLKKETFFHSNRWYLLCTPVLSHLLPLFEIEGLSYLVPSGNLVLLPEVQIGSPGDVQEGILHDQKAHSLPWYVWTYISGCLLAAVLLIKKCLWLNNLFQNKILRQEKRFRIISLPASNDAFSFYDTIFLGDDLTEPEKAQVLAHELVHVREKHSMDLVFFEIWKVFFWFNPAIYLFQSRITALHEFIADASAVKETGKEQYYQQLLNTVFKTKEVSFINQFFNQSLIKKRIVMLQKNKSRTIKKMKFLIVLPLLIAMLTYVACSSPSDNSVAAPQGDSKVLTVEVEDLKALTPEEKLKIQKTIDDITEGVQAEIVVTDGTNTFSISKDGVPTQSEILKSPAEPNDFSGGIPFAVVEEVPVFPGCEDLTSNAERKECMSQKITDFVNRNFDVAAVKEFARPGLNRIYVQFMIGQSGTIEKVRSRASTPELGAEAERVIAALPKMKPATHDGKEVGVLYMIPIQFKVGQ